MTKTSTSAKDVAELAGVSRAAVSRCFTPGASISPETRARILKAADTLGYQVNRLASGLIRNESGIVALISAELATPFRSKLLAALTEALQRAGKVALVINTDGSNDSAQEALRQAISYRTDAAIFLSGMPARSLAETCQRNGMRLVLISRNGHHPGSLLVRSQDEEAGRRALAMLRAAGCERPALASSLTGTPSLLARERGFREAAREAGIEPAEARLGATSYDTGLELGMSLLTRPDRPDGIFCTTDLMACGVMDAARWRLGIRIPDQLSLIGFDDIPQAGWEGYDLTTFQQPVEDIASRSVEWLISKESGSEIEELILEPRLKSRSSVKRGTGGSDQTASA
ncbi:MAG TPA: LacI family DNA-binding transcriptional regulator [Paracoccus sp. (in: a-proteobacteria)]|uniref:LacI family DNA-binding transcriptional regulator n=1 Tax=uncultured Paracoccus sp. TaxID=189685 RepID=UPI00262C5CF6|nr:LacI family DNA-binding transcriptional regulator [uncultured Paracoccus sp.]HMQ40980.1 LacI family DNA-binding transcriptional regulator [Paracoccus sp. (in: a-proteobacteria)]HMR35172.1 LacI family DNA-binding transcriptional regulator [Paracoccus sp. (in: a-proteobacteria)]